MKHKALIRRLQISCLGLDPIDPLRLLVDDVIEALAQPEQEPVAWKLPDKNVVFWEDTKEVDEYHGFKPTIPLYTTPPQRTWVGLTDDDWDDIFGDAMTIGEAIKATEAKLKQKNGYAEEKNT